MSGEFVSARDFGPNMCLGRLRGTSNASLATLIFYFLFFVME